MWRDKNSFEGRTELREHPIIGRFSKTLSVKRGVKTRRNKKTSSKCSEVKGTSWERKSRLSCWREKVERRGNKGRMWIEGLQWKV